MTSPANHGLPDPNGRITCDRRGHLLLIGLDRVAKRNAFTPKMHVELQDALTTLDEDPDLWAGVVFGHGDHFTGGLDLPKFTAWMDSGRPILHPDRVDPWGRGRRCRKPMITAVQGVTYTAGIELMLAGDITVAASDCRFAQMEPLRGIMATGGAIPRFIQRGGWGNAMYHLLTGQEFGAAEALRIGLVQEVVAPGQSLPRALELAELVLRCAPLAVQATKANGLVAMQQGEGAAFRAAISAQSDLRRTQDAAEGLAAFVARRPANFAGQ